MRNSILNNIKKWAEENNYPFTCIIYKIDKNFPKAFHDTIINYINSIRRKGEKAAKIEDFAIMFTPDKHVYLEFLYDHNRVVITEDNVWYDKLPPAKIIRESTFLQDVEKLDNKRLNEFVSSLSPEYAHRFSQTTTLEDMNKKITNNIIDYIEYCLEERKQSVEKISFIEAEPAKNAHPTGHLPEQKKPRKNEELSYDDRKNVLDSYPSEYEFEANASNTNSSYSVKVYKVRNVKYRIIMEPKEGNKYTKVVHINKDKLSLGEAKTIVINTLELDRTQITNSSNITRHTHTSLSEFKKLIEYLVTENDSGITYSTKRNIEETETTKKR